jgi:hypothetical protein
MLNALAISKVCLAFRAELVVRVSWACSSYGRVVPHGKVALR